MGRKEREGYTVTLARHMARQPSRPPTRPHWHRHHNLAKPPGTSTMIWTDGSTVV